MHSEVEGLTAQAKAQTGRDQFANPQKPEQIQLSPRDIAGIAAEPLRLGGSSAERTDIRSRSRAAQGIRSDLPGSGGIR